LPEGEFYAFEIIGLRVEEEGGRAFGVVRDVLPGPANDNLELDDGTLVPMIEDAIRSIDPSGGVVLLNPGFID
jgi:16S rRNA processing protein RimM